MKLTPRGLIVATESHGGGKQLCKGIPHALIQQESPPESALWYKYPSLISEQKQVNSKMCTCTELDTCT